MTRVRFSLSEIAELIVGSVAVAQEPPPNAKYARRYEEECQALTVCLDCGTNAGLYRLRDGVWGEWKDTDDDAPNWGAYRDWLHHRCGTRTLYRMLPDGTFELMTGRTEP